MADEKAEQEKAETAKQEAAKAEQAKQEQIKAETLKQEAAKAHAATQQPAHTTAQKAEQEAKGDPKIAASELELGIGILRTHSAADIVGSTFHSAMIHLEAAHAELRKSQEKK